MISSVNAQSLLSYYSSSTTSSSSSSTGNTTLASLLSDSSNLSGTGLTLSNLLSGSGVWDQSSTSSDLFGDDSGMQAQITYNLVSSINRNESEILDKIDAIWQKINQRGNHIPSDLKEQIETLEQTYTDAVEEAGSYISADEEAALGDLEDQLTALYEEAGIFPTDKEQAELDALEAKLDRLYGIDRAEVNSLTARQQELMEAADEIYDAIAARLASDPDLQAQADEIEAQIEQYVEALDGAEDTTGGLAKLEEQLGAIYEEAGAEPTAKELAELESIIAELDSVQDQLDAALEGDGGVMQILADYTDSLQSNSNYLQQLSTLWSGTTSDSYSGSLTGKQLLSNLMDDLDTLMSTNPGSVHSM